METAMRAEQSAIRASRSALTPSLTPALLAVAALVLMPGPLAARALARYANGTPRYMPQANTAPRDTGQQGAAAARHLRNGLRGSAATAPRYAGQRAVAPQRTGVPRSGVPGSTTAPRSATMPESTSVPGSAGVPGSTNAPGPTGAAPRSTAPGSTSSLTTSTTPPASVGSTPAPAVPSTTSQARSRGGGGFTPSTPAIALAALAALLLLLVAAWALARAFAYEPAWIPSLRHSFAEAGFRASATWAELGDWLRLGR
jgi:hypothetical protein